MNTTHEQTLYEFVASIKLRIESLIKVQKAQDKDVVPLYLFQLRDIVESWLDMADELRRINQMNQNTLRQAELPIIEVKPGDSFVVEANQIVILRVNDLNIGLLDQVDPIFMQNHIIVAK